jgi:adenosylcobinamide kinase/adenosylcobinamide-phosphate guanylyltransferase
VRKALVIGGARSGKTAAAQQLAVLWAAQTGWPVTYVATAQASDAEMAERIERHRRDRPAEWETAEVPLDAAAWLQAAPPRVVIIDCLSLLLNNWMYLESDDEEHLRRRLDELCGALRAAKHAVIIVSNEVGQGIVPADSFSRRYRDWLGWLNQAVAAVADEVYWVVAGIPVDVRRWQASWYAG